MNMENEIEIFRAEREDLDIMIEWAAREGWNPGLNDAECFWAADPEGFWTARLNGEMVACMSVVRHERGFAFLGFYTPAFISCIPIFVAGGSGWHCGSLSRTRSIDVW